MSVALGYLAAKANEYSTISDWVEQELLQVDNFQSKHPYLHHELTARISDARHRVRQLRTIVLLNRPGLVPRGVSVVNQLQWDVYLLSENYLPALKKEGQRESRFATVALDAAHRCGFSSIREILVSLSGGHAILSALPVSPLLFVPPHQVVTLLDIAGIYHEFGHVAFITHQQIGDVLTQTVTGHFRALEQAAGFLSPDERAKRHDQIRKAEQYWILSRLEELFCDIFASYVVGPAHYYSCVDMAIRWGDHPYEIDIADVHPPIGARVSVCRMALSPEQSISEVSEKSSGLWQYYAGARQTTADYRLFCDENLLREVVDQSIRTLTSLRYQRYSRTNYDLNRQAAADVNLEELLNDSALMFLRDSAGYAAWERPLVEALFG